MKKTIKIKIDRQTLKRLEWLAKDNYIDIEKQLDIVINTYFDLVYKDTMATYEW